MYTKYELDKYYIDGEVIDTPIHTEVDLNSCGTSFYSNMDGNMRGFISPLKGKNGSYYAIFVSDTPNGLLHDGNCSIDCPDLRFDNKCWYIDYEDYVNTRETSYLECRCLYGFH